MKKNLFLGKLILFCILFLIASELMNELYIANVFAYRTMVRTEEQFNKKVDAVSILIAGDSHPEYDVYPPYIDGSFVVATGGENIVHTYYRIKKYIERGMDIDLVLLPIDLHSFSSYRTDRVGNEFFWRHFFDYQEIGRLKNKRAYYFFLRLKGEFAYIDGVYATKSLIDIFSGKEELAMIIDGHFVSNEDWSKEPKPLIGAKSILKTQLVDFEPLDHHLKYFFIKTLHLLDDNNIQAVLVRYPMSNAYYQIAGKYVNIDNYYSQIYTMLRNEGLNFPILDYHDLYVLNQNFFYDANHLNETGAKEFTKVLKLDLKNMGLLEN